MGIRGGREGALPSMVAVFAASNIMRRWRRGRLTPDHDNDGITPDGTLS